MDVRFRPLSLWTHPDTPPERRRSRWTFKAGWGDTLDLLDRELDSLGARDVVIACFLRDQDIRMDGWPRSSARVPSHPGIEVSFQSDVQPQRLVYATDSCVEWQHNVRSIALGLEALRAVDRYGITSRGQQYAGFKELPAGEGEPSVAKGEALVEHYGGVKNALRATHPDHNGPEASTANFQSVRMYQTEATSVR